MSLQKLSTKERLWSVITILLMLGIFINSSFPSKISKDPFPQFDKVLHASVWAILSLSIVFATQHQIFNDTVGRRFKLMLIILFASFYGLVDELHQYYIPTRVMDIFDVVADATGSILGTLFSYRMLQSIYQDIES